MTYCDFPGKDTCQIAESEIDLLRPDGEKFIYLTFDDGPWVGTTEVLDALKDHSIKVTISQDHQLEVK